MSTFSGHAKMNIPEIININDKNILSILLKFIFYLLINHLIVKTISAIGQKIDIKNIAIISVLE